MGKFRRERDSMGALKVPADALWGASTQRAVNNFQISGKVMPRGFIRALGLIKAACASANQQLGLLGDAEAKAIIKAAEHVAHGIHDEHFPVDVFQTGSGTSSNMNANEVIANVALRSRVKVHPNDHVNMGQSSNDVIPSALHLSAAMEVKERLLPALDHLAQVTETRAVEFRRRGQDRPHSPHGRYAAVARPGIRRLGGPIARLFRSPRGGAEGAAMQAGAGRNGGWYRY